MKIDFTKIMARPSLDAEETAIDVANVLGNTIYNEANTIEEDTLARKIHASKGEIELDEAEAEIVRKNLKVFRFWLRTAIEGLLTNKE